MLIWTKDTYIITEIHISNTECRANICNEIILQICTTWSWSLQLPAYVHCKESFYNIYIWCMSTVNPDETALMYTLIWVFPFALGIRLNICSLLMKLIVKLVYTHHDQGLRHSHYIFLKIQCFWKWNAKPLIRLRVCADWSKFAHFVHTVRPICLVYKQVN